MAITYNDLYLDIRHKLRRAGTSAAALEARVLLCFAAGKTREELVRDLNLYVSAELEQQARALAERRLDGEPVAYLVGEWEFYGLPLDVSPEVLIPRTDTELLAGEAIRLAREAGDGARLLDLCAGSGCVGLAAAAGAEACRVVLADLSEAALRICRRNIRRNGLSARVTCVRLDAGKEPFSALGDFDVIACNPPYIPSGDMETLDPSVRKYEPRLALDGGADGLDFYRAIIPAWGKALRAGGAMLFEVGIGQAKAVRAMLEAQGYANIAVLPDTQGIDRVVRGTLGERAEAAKDRPEAAEPEADGRGGQAGEPEEAAKTETDETKDAAKTEAGEAAGRAAEPEADGRAGENEEKTGDAAAEANKENAK